MCDSLVKKWEEEMRLLHTGDLHLDSAFCSLGTKSAEAQRQEGRELLKRIFDTARDESCEMLLISGDLFDGKFVSPESAELFCSLVEKCNIPVVLSPGNHDWYFENSFYDKAQKRLGDRLTLFTTAELQMFDFDELGVRVYGYAFCSPSLTDSPLSGAVIPENNNRYITLLCAHCDISSPVSRYAPITVAEIEALGVDYAALGHIHNRAENTELDGRVRYCGFPQGRGYDELGEGGVWIVDINGENIECTRKILSRQSFHVLECGLPDYDGIEALADKLCNKIKSKRYPEGARLRMIIDGECTDDAVISKELEGLVLENSGLDELELVDRTLPAISGEYLEQDFTLRGELYRTLKPMLLSADPEERKRATMALKIGLCAIDGRSIYGNINDK